MPTWPAWKEVVRRGASSRTSSGRSCSTTHIAVCSSSSPTKSSRRKERSRSRIAWLKAPAHQTESAGRATNRRRGPAPQAGSGRQAGPLDPAHAGAHRHPHEVRRYRPQQGHDVGQSQRGILPPADQRRDVPRHPLRFLGAHPAGKGPAPTLRSRAHAGRRGRPGLRRDRQAHRRLHGWRGRRRTGATAGWRRGLPRSRSWSRARRSTATPRSSSA